MLTISYASEPIEELLSNPMFFTTGNGIDSNALIWARFLKDNQPKMAHTLTVSISLNVTGPLLPEGKLVEAFNDTLTIPSEFDVPISFYERLFGDPQFDAIANESTGANSLAVTAHIGPWNKTITIPFELPAVVSTIRDELESFGYGVEVKIDAKVA